MQIVYLLLSYHTANKDAFVKTVIKIHHVLLHYMVLVPHIPLVLQVELLQVTFAIASI